MSRNSLLSFLALVGLYCFAAGCGKTTEDEKTGAKKSERQTKPANELFVGTWVVTIRIDEEKAMSDLKRKAQKVNANVSEEDLKKGYELGKKVAENTKATLTMNADGTSETKTEIPHPFDANRPPRKDSERSNWKIVSEDGRLVTLKVTPTEGQRKGVAKTLRITIVDDHTFMVTEVDGERVPGTMTYSKQ